MAILYLRYYRPRTIYKYALFILLSSLIVYTGCFLSTLSTIQELNDFLFFIPVLIFSITINLDKIIDYFKIRPYFTCYYLSLFITLIINTLLFFSFCVVRRLPFILGALPVLNPVDGF
jgi:hypothetical protein